MLAQITLSRFSMASSLGISRVHVSNWIFLSRQRSFSRTIVPLSTLNATAFTNPRTQVPFGYTQLTNVFTSERKLTDTRAMNRSCAKILTSLLVHTLLPSAIILNRTAMPDATINRKTVMTVASTKLIHQRRAYGCAAGLSSQLCLFIAMTVPMIAAGMRLAAKTPGRLRWRSNCTCTHSRSLPISSLDVLFPVLAHGSEWMFCDAKSLTQLRVCDCITYMSWFFYLHCRDLLP